MRGACAVRPTSVPRLLNLMASPFIFQAFCAMVRANSSTCVRLTLRLLVFYAEHFLGNVRGDGFDPSGDAVPIVFVGFTGVGWRGLGCWLFRFQMDEQRGFRSAGMPSDFGFRWFHFDRLVLFGFLDLIHGERERGHGEREHEPVHASFRRELSHPVDDAGGVRMGDVWAVVHNRVQSALVFLMVRKTNGARGVLACAIPLKHCPTSL